MRIVPVQPDNPEIIEYIHALDAYQETLYPAESNHLDGTETLKQSNVIMAGALDSDSRIRGMGAVKFLDGYGEIKRMFVPESQRKKGLHKKFSRPLSIIPWPGIFP